MRYTHEALRVLSHEYDGGHYTKIVPEPEAASLYALQKFQETNGAMDM